MRGAEAVVSRTIFLERPSVIKDRITKKYRIKELDEKLRTSRTRIEARILHRAKLAGVKCPVVLKVDVFSITMTFIKGDRPEMDAGESREAGKILAKLHSAGIIHGDYTPANLLKSGKELYVIDFGLGYLSGYTEDKAVDVYTMLRALDENGKKEFLKGYRTYKKHKAVFKRLEDIQKRVRYA
jgi:TP53 regulating kinase-like protein